VDVSSKYLPATILHTVSVIDDDGDAITCTMTSTFLSVDRKS
jgi:hypothetical protein